MVREIIACLRDIIEVCDSIASILADISIDTYVEMREKRSTVEREFFDMRSSFSPDWIRVRKLQASYG